MEWARSLQVKKRLHDREMQRLLDEQREAASSQQFTAFDDEGEVQSENNANLINQLNERID